ncbi:DUF1570 domain-containing protein [Candidatus Uabimicrobium sp. HlEnr_7]|uniref:DUF1570 domain-containing protein n=1 Tax=Candidatus Uabimicrobium helgolandensis TaxID=3095367 RepID=UPI003557D77C
MKRWKPKIIKWGVVLLPLFTVVFVLKIFLPMISKQVRTSQFGNDKSICETTHFYTLTKKIPESPKDVAISCENFYSAFVEEHKSQIAFKELENKIEVFFFGNRKEFDEYYKKQYMRSIPHNAAFYSPLQQRIVLYWNNNTRETLYHELTHMILDIAVNFHEPQFSVWFNEGLAMYFEKYTVQNGALIVGDLDKDAVLFVRQAYKNRLFVPLTALCQSQSADFRSSQNSIYYYESYLFIYFLKHVKGNDIFLRYFKEEGKSGPCSPYALSNILQKPNVEIEKEFLAYFKIN